MKSKEITIKTLLTVLTYFFSTLFLFIGVFGILLATTELQVLRSIGLLLASYIVTR